MILSDRDLKAELTAGRLVVEPLGANAIQPSSIDLHVGRQFRVFANTRYPYIDVRRPMDDLTELVEVDGDEPFILHPGEFVLGTTLERVEIPNDLVARLDGKSSLGRLGLLIHSSLPGSEEVLFLTEDGYLVWLEVGDIVRKSITGSVVAFDPETFSVGYHRVTGWYEGPPDVIYEVRLASGRSVRTTAGHSLFTVDAQAMLKKVRASELLVGSLVAVPKRIPDPDLPPPHLRVLDLVPESEWNNLVVEGEPIGRFLDEHAQVAKAILKGLGYAALSVYRRRKQLPLLAVAQVPELLAAVHNCRLRVKGARASMPATVEVDSELAWLIGLYLAEGSRSRSQVTLSNTDQDILDRVERVMNRLGQPTSRSMGAVVVCSEVFSLLVEHMAFGPTARSKRIPPTVLAWPAPLLESFLSGFSDGDGLQGETRLSLWTSSERLAGDLLTLAARLGGRAASYLRMRRDQPHFQVALPCREHKLLTSIPLPDGLLVSIRTALGWPLRQAAQQIGYKNATDLANLEHRWGRDAIRSSTARRLVEGYASCPDAELLARLARLADGDLAWDRVAAVVRLEAEPVFDLSVQPDGKKIENFLAGQGGVFVANTAGFVDPGFRGHLTLEFSNVANLPITLYPGMKIGQISFFRMSSPAENPYGTGPLASKYLDQEGPTPSRYWENFESSE